jgi:GNAT superfamily N-acetyltransferase
VNIRISDLSSDTITDAVTLLQAQLREHEIETPADLLRDVVVRVQADAREGFMLLAHDGAQPVGIAYAAAHLSAEHGGISGWLEELYVVPSSRGSGVGSALLREVVERAQALAWRGVELEVVAGHERAAPLYQRHGFAPTPRARFTRLFPR